MQTLQVTLPNALKAYNEADNNGKKLLENLLGKTILDQKITDRVQTFDDILAISGRTMNSLIQCGDTPDEIAYKKVKLITEVYNEGTVLDPMNTKQYKYYPWHEITPGSGFGLSCYVYGCWYTTSNVGVRLCFKSEELAIDAGKKFIEIYADLKIK